MKKALAIFVCVCLLTGGEYFAISKWAIRHETLSLFGTRRSVFMIRRDSGRSQSISRYVVTMR